jgi:hypothetical protein
MNPIDNFWPEVIRWTNNQTHEAFVLQNPWITQELIALSGILTKMAKDKTNLRYQHNTQKPWAVITGCTDDKGNISEVLIHQILETLSTLEKKYANEIQNSTISAENRLLCIICTWLQLIEMQL